MSSICFVGKILQTFLSTKPAENVYKMSKKKHISSVKNDLYGVIVAKENSWDWAENLLYLVNEQPQW